MHIASRLCRLERVYCSNPYALAFDGVDDSADCGNNEILNITDKITIEAWVQHNTGIPNTWEDMVMKGNETYGFQFYEDEGFFTFHLTSGVWRNLSSNTRPVSGEWFQLPGRTMAIHRKYMSMGISRTLPTGLEKSKPTQAILS